MAQPSRSARLRPSLVQGLSHEFGPDAKAKAFDFLDDVLRPAADARYGEALRKAKVAEPRSWGKRARTISRFQEEERAKSRR
eukprot:6335721-Prymnesium_polylepis.1